MDLQALLRAVISFRDERDWAQYHNPKDLAISLALEAAELLEIFQWKSPEEVRAIKSDEQACRYLTIVIYFIVGVVFIAEKDRYFYFCKKYGLKFPSGK